MTNQGWITTFQSVNYLLLYFFRDEYTLAELTATPIPEGVDPTRLEQYLNKPEFKVIYFRQH